jgi:hypothetical protein
MDVAISGPGVEHVAYLPFVVLLQGLFQLHVFNAEAELVPFFSIQISLVWVSEIGQNTAIDGMNSSGSNNEPTCGSCGRPLFEFSDTSVLWPVSVQGSFPARRAVTEDAVMCWSDPPVRASMPNWRRSLMFSMRFMAYLRLGE